MCKASLFAITEICRTHTIPDALGLLPYFVSGYLSPEQMTAAANFVKNFHNLGWVFRPNGSDKQGIVNTCADAPSLGSGLLNIFQSHAKIPQGDEDIQTTEIPYMSGKLMTGDFSDLLNLDNFEAWAASARNHKLVSEWMALSHLLRGRIGSDIVLRSPFSLTSGYNTIQLVNALVCYIAAFHISEKSEIDHQKPKSLVNQIVKFADKFPGHFCVRYEDCLMWTTKVKFDNKYIPGFTVWAAILLAFATSCPSPNKEGRKLQFSDGAAD